MTPVTKQLETSHSTRTVDYECSSESSSNSETPAKKMHRSQSAEAVTSSLHNENFSITSFSTPNIKSESRSANSRCHVNSSKIGTPLSELQGNSKFVPLQSTEKIIVAQSMSSDLENQSVANKGNGSETLRFGSNSKTLSKIVLYDKDEKSCCDINKKPMKIHELSSERSVILDRSLNSRSTPVSSRSSLRTSQFRVNKLDFDKEAERTVSLPGTDNEFQSKSLGAAKMAEETFADTYGNDKPLGAGISAVNKSETKKIAETVTGGNYEEKQRLLKEISEKEEVLRKLKMVKMYRTKNNLTQLQCLIEKWRGVTQQGLQDLHDALPEPKPSLTELLQHLGVDNNLVKFDPAEETFS